MDNLKFSHVSLRCKKNRESVESKKENPLSRNQVVVCLFVIILGDFVLHPHNFLLRFYKYMRFLISSFLFLEAIFHENNTLISHNLKIIFTHTKKKI